MASGISAYEMDSTVWIHVMRLLVMARDFKVYITINKI